MRAAVFATWALTLVACSNATVHTDVPAKSAGQTSAPASEASAGRPTPAASEDAATVMNAPPETMTLISFAPGSDVLSAQANALLQAVAARLRGDSQQMVVVRGFAARQGSKEYAVAIAERRVRAVEQALARLKVPGSQVRRRNLGTEVHCSGNSGNACPNPARVELVLRKKSYP